METRRRGRPAASDREAALQEALRRHRAGERLDLLRLATDLGVGRSTLYLWFGTRDKLIAEVLTRSAGPMLRDARRRATGSAGEWLVTYLDSYNRSLAADAGLMGFIRRERDTALRLMTDPGGLVHPMVVDYFTGLVREAMTQGYRPPLEPRTLTISLTRMAEALLFVEGVVRDPDVKTLRAAQAAMLGVPEHAYPPDPATS